MKAWYALILGVAPLFVGCESKEEIVGKELLGSEVKTVAWYKENPTERENVLKVCKDNVGLLKDNANCQNASAALATAFESKERIEGLKPITFGNKPAAAEPEAPESVGSPETGVTQSDNPEASNE